MKTRLLAGTAIVGLSLLLPASAAAQTEVVEYYGVDALGSVRVVFDSAGNLINRMDYGPFGEQLAGSTFSRRVYAQLFRDGETGQDYAEARSYQSRTGRFVSVDPVDGSATNPQSWNRYSYVLNNPVSFVDPEGMQAESCSGYAVYSGSNDKPEPIRTGITCQGGGGGGGASYNLGQFFRFNPFFAFSPGGVIGGSQEGGPKGAQQRGQPVIGPVPTTTSTTPTNSPPPSGCNPITLEGCAPNPFVEGAKAFVAGTRDALKAIWATPSESCLVLFGSQVLDNMNPFNPSPTELAPAIAGGWAAVEHNRDGIRRISTELPRWNGVAVSTEVLRISQPDCDSKRSTEQGIGRADGEPRNLAGGRL